MFKNKNNSIAKSLIFLAIPTIIEQLLSTLLQYVDTAMVGHLGEKATAAISVTTTITWLVNSISSGLGIAFLAMISQAFGRNDEKQIKKICKHTFLAAISVGLFLSIISIVLSPFIPIWMNAEKDICKTASIYFAIISVPLVFRCFSTLFGSALRAVKDTKTPMYISLFTNFINMLLNFFFIYGLSLGVTGAGIASAISYTIGGTLMFISFRKKDILHFNFCNMKPDKNVLKKLFEISLPLLGTNIASCLGYVFFAGMVSGMGTTIFAAHSIAVNAEEIFYIPGYGLRSATSAMAGHAYGEKNQKKLFSVCKVSIIITLIMMLINGFILFFVSKPLMSIFTNSKTVVDIGSAMLKLVAFSEPFFGLMIVMEGIFYGLGKTKYPFIVETISMWCVRILMTYFCVKIWHLGLKYVWYCMIADNVCKAILLFLPLLISKNRLLSIEPRQKN